MIKTDDLFDLSECKFKDIFSGQEVWDVLARIKPYIKEHIRPNVKQILDCGNLLTRTAVIHQGEVFWEGFRIIPGDTTKKKLKVLMGDNELEGASVIYAGAFIMDEDVEIGAGSVIESGALIKGPTIIGDYTEVRQGAYMRGSCLIGNHAVVGHATEVKNAIMMNSAKAGHFAYLGDSILGNNTNLGAGTKLANLKIRGATITITVGKERINTGLRKMGAILGDGVETGCNTVTNPGVILGKKVLVYPNTSVKSGYYSSRQVIS